MNDDIDDLFSHFQRVHESARISLARLMVQRFLGDLIAAGDGTEDQFVVLYLRLAQQAPESGMEAVAERLRAGYLAWKEQRAIAARAPTIIDLGAP